jgi:hypothetical protein
MTGDVEYPLVKADHSTYYIDRLIRCEITMLYGLYILIFVSVVAAKVRAGMPDLLLYVLSGMIALSFIYDLFWVNDLQNDRNIWRIGFVLLAALAGIFWTYATQASV